MRRDVMLYGLIGYPLSHSLSPLMHNAAFKKLGIPARYQLFPLKEEELKDFLINLPSSHIRGINVTIPYKEKVIPYLDKISPEAEKIGAVNTIKVVRAKRLYGYNTDARGFLQDIKERFRFHPKGKEAAILGAGGAAKAVAFALLSLSLKKLVVYDIDLEKGRRLRDDLGRIFEADKIEIIPCLDNLINDNTALLVNATPVGMRKDDPVLISKEKLRKKDLLVYDLVYNPPVTGLVKLARSQGLKAANGLGMLLYQGALAFKIWTGKDAPIETMRRALRKGVK